LIDRKLLIASLNAQVPARDYLASFVKSDRLLGRARLPENSCEPTDGGHSSIRTTMGCGVARGAGMGLNGKSQEESLIPIRSRL
jgi:hypothetical protein